MHEDVITIPHGDNMNYLFFDTECANCYNGNAKIYSFGYVLTDEDFNVIEGPRDLLINPASNFDPYVRKKILAYDKKIFKDFPKFDGVYEQIKMLMTAENTVCFGFGATNDLNFLADDCKRYALKPLTVPVFDVQKLIEVVDGRQAKKLDSEYTERTGKEPRAAHRSDEDAMRTMEVAKSICATSGKKLHEYFLDEDGSPKILPALLSEKKIQLPYSFKKAQTIWAKTEFSVDDYAEFKVELPKLLEGGIATLRVSCDGAFAAYVNDKPIAFSQCADFPHRKRYDEKNISSALSEGGELLIRVWHFGEDSANYVKGDAGVIFEVDYDGEVVAFSSENTPSRVMNEYKNGYCKKITGQLGYSFLYDMRAIPGDYSDSVARPAEQIYYPRGRKGLKLGRRATVRKKKKGGSLLIDMLCETCGFFDIDVTSTQEIKLTVCYGEHLKDGGHVRRIIANRDFSVEIILKKGRNRYLNPFRKLAGRYLEVFAEFIDDKKSGNPLDCIKFDYVGLREVYYPSRIKKLDFGDDDINAITEACIRTLRVCMHEHYEDCAWREQGLYSLDSRNQALCGYYVFSGSEYQRSNIVMLADGLRDDGLLSLTVPGGIDYPIPFFSLCYFQTVYEYVLHTGDKSILDEVAPTLRRIYSVFESNICDNGLIARFSPAPYWNFYEWTAGLDGGSDDVSNPVKKPKQTVFDAPLNLAFIIASGYYDKLFNEKHDLSYMKQAVRDKFFDKERGEFFIAENDNRSSQLVTALAILAGIGGKKDAEKMLGGGQTAASLSTKAFVYDALLSIGGYKEYIIDDIKRVYLNMLANGATTVWEVEIGSEEFGGAASLCHGWSAIPVYYFCRLLK